MIVAQLEQAYPNSDLELAPYAGHTISGDRYYRKWTSLKLTQASAGADTGFYLQYDALLIPTFTLPSFDSPKLGV